jgi:putative transposase
MLKAVSDQAGGLVSGNHFVYEAKLLRVKLNDRKIRWLIQEKLRGRGSGELALIQKVTCRRVEQLWQTYRGTGITPTLKKPGRPRNSRDLKEAAVILEAYDQHRLGAVNLERIINTKLGVHIPHNRIHEVLRMNGKATPQPSKQRRRRWVRYEREHSMSLWHMDWKQLNTGEWILAILDDASRYIVGYGTFKEATAPNTLQVLKEAIQNYGKPDEILTDRGSQFYANEGERKEKGISQFEQHLADHEIKHILCRVNHPQTNGKLERFYGVLEDKMIHRAQIATIPEYVHWHNEIKPHMSLDWENLETPIQAFHRKLPQDRKEITQTIQEAK